MTSPGGATRCCSTWAAAARGRCSTRRRRGCGRSVPRPGRGRPGVASRRWPCSSTTGPRTSSPAAGSATCWTRSGGSRTGRWTRPPSPPGAWTAPRCCWCPTARRPTPPTPSARPAGRRCSTGCRVAAATSAGAAAPAWPPPSASPPPPWPSRPPTSRAACCGSGSTATAPSATASALRLGVQRLRRGHAGQRPRPGGGRLPARRPPRLLRLRVRRRGRGAGRHGRGGRRAGREWPGGAVLVRAQLPRLQRRHPAAAPQRRPRAGAGGGPRHRGGQGAAGRGRPGRRRTAVAPGPAHPGHGGGRRGGRHRTAAARLRGPLPGPPGRRPGPLPGRQPARPRDRRAPVRGRPGPAPARAQPAGASLQHALASGGRPRAPRGRRWQHERHGQPRPATVRGAGLSPPDTLDPKALVDEFAGGYRFELDDFQRRGCLALAAGQGALVAAPTGAGKTVVGEFAVWLALRSGGKAFYTTPLKALSNQKFGDFVARHGAAKVGLLTGDNSINGEAPVVVMTTEVLRNMLYEGSPTLGGLVSVVMDEVHYLQDPYRGAVWEEVLIHLPVGVRVASLSATVSNAEEFGEWLEATRGATEVVIEERRPVPLDNHYLIGRELHPLFVTRGDDVVPNPALARSGEQAWRPGRDTKGRPHQ